MRGVINSGHYAEYAQEATVLVVRLRGCQSEQSYTPKQLKNKITRPAKNHQKSEILRKNRNPPPGAKSSNMKAVRTTQHTLHQLPVCAHRQSLCEQIPAAALMR